MKESKLDAMAFGAHPDDAELGCGGLLVKWSRKGYRLGITDLTKSELSTRGTPESREREAQQATEFLGLDVREQMEFPDGHLKVTRERKEKVAERIRKHRPRIILAPYWDDFHPDHEAASNLVYEASVLASRAAHESDHPYFATQKIVYYMIHHDFDPSFVVDISDVWKEKKKLVRMYRTQLHEEESGGDVDVKTSNLPRTNLSDRQFMDRYRSRHVLWGREIGVSYGEPYYVRGSVPVEDPVETFADGKLRDHLRPTSG